MPRFKYSMIAAAGILVLVFVLSVIGPKRVMAALGYTPVRDVDFAARQPILVSLNTTYKPVHTIPSDKRLVIEFVSVSASVPNGEVRDVGLQTWDAGLTGYTQEIYFPLTQMTNAQNVRSLAYAGTAKIYVDPNTAGFAPGTALKLVAGGTSGSGGVYADLVFSGYLEPLK